MPGLVARRSHLCILVRHTTDTIGYRTSKGERTARTSSALLDEFRTAAEQNA
ncbi:MAG TPA: hypothetical protein VHC69_29330 [Polyangiaceae bacterium]|nr:hypothetical protein [Polyangiaceae bacterium]